ncbi:MAG: branched-chain amino acid ABC transporter permease [Treponema sp.]|jgi:branched-chain amino acid transport system permease protein|nr:branched-chain amino acid ABC transporter permease [Treponema sp.]
MFSTGEIILQQLVNGVILGSFYALVALGYSMVYGIIKLLNFAHGDIYMTGAFICFTVFGILSAMIGGPAGVILAILAAMIFCAVLGFFVQRIAYRPLFDAPRLSLLITAIGVSLVINNTIMVYTNSQFLFFNSGLDNKAGFPVGEHITLTYIQITMVLITAALMVGLNYFIGKTMWGKAMRAISLDKDTCRLMGINVNKVIGLTFMIGSSLAAVAGGMACVYYGNVHYFMGYIIGMKAFTSAVIGGIGSLPGAMLGGLVLGILEAAGTQVIGSEWKDVFAFAILITMLIFRPNGLLGKTEIERM